MSSWGAPPTWSTWTSAAPATVSTTRAISSAFCFSTSRSSPKSLMASSARTPSSSSSTVMAIGCVKLVSTPGISPSSARMASCSSSWLSASRHWPLGWSRRNISALLIGSVWAPTSPRPMRGYGPFDLGDFQEAALDQHGDAGALLEGDGGSHGQPQDHGPFLQGRGELRPEGAGRLQARRAEGCRPSPGPRSGGRRNGRLWVR